MTYIIRIFFGIVLSGFLWILSSCNPEGLKPTPGNYIINGPQDVEPAFSLDGNFIAYAHLYDTAKNYPPGLYIIERNGSNRKLVLDGFNFSPAWSPDGQWLVFTSGGTIKKCKIDGSQLTIFMGLTQLKYREFYYPDWSTNGKHIVFDNPFPSDGGGIFQIDSDFTGHKRLFNSNEFGRNPEVSPLENYLVYYDWIKGWNFSEIFIRDTLGNPPIRLTLNNRDDRAPTWSYDGKKIAWSSNSRLSLMNSDGSNQVEIGFGSDPSWSINNEIVYSHANSNYTKEVLYIVAPDGKNKRQITQ